ncbi:MAG: DEAD/DEAH box helicase [Planctomycetes bacterium]|nr:DEAD/DEAH box helicase [Planctomycetota bacterium]
MDVILAAVRRTWDYETLRPLQREAIEASLARRDALVVLPTGGGKSLCYQVPALIESGLTVVISPLISLMKDQVDRLAARGIASAFLNSSLDAGDGHPARPRGYRVAAGAERSVGARG